MRVLGDNSAFATGYDNRAQIPVLRLSEGTERFLACLDFAAALIQGNKVRLNAETTKLACQALSPIWAGVELAAGDEKAAERARRRAKA